MKIHEYQAKEIFRKFGLPVPNGKLAKTADEAYDIAKWLGTMPVVVKAQIHAGGRGKDILGMMLKTKQTGPEGQEVKKVYIEEGSKIAKELYVALSLDRETS